MKTRNVILLALITGLLFASCKKDIVDNKGFQKSYRTWQNFKSASGNSYRYTVVTSSWVGTSTETIITVRKGKVVGRSYIRKSVSQTSAGGPVTINTLEQWEENESSLNTHAYGAAAITLDEIYNKAENDWLKKRNDTITFFETENDGMISSCGYIPKQCADDCFTGITITSIEKL